MANDKFDGVIEAVHYLPDGQVDWVRGYLRRGITWTDRLILKRADLIDQIKSGKKVMLGKRTTLKGSVFEVSVPVQVVQRNGIEMLNTSSSSTDRDQLEGLPVL
jgi:hypothetical protein